MAFQPQNLATALNEAVERAVAQHGLESCAQVLVDPRVAGPIAEAIPGGAALVEGIGIQSHVIVHLQGAFQADLDCNTPLDFIPVPVSAGTVKGALAGAMLNHLLGMETVSYGSENCGEPFVSLVPQAGKGRRVRKSHASMRGHTDGVSFPFPGTRDEQFYRMAPAPDWVCLACLRNPHDVATRVVPVAPLLSQLSPELRTALREPQFTIGAQGTFKDGMKDILGIEHIVDGGALLDGGEDFSFRFSHSSVTPGHEASPQAQEVLNTIEAYCAANSESVILKCGDLFWVNNRQAIHGRAEVGTAIGGHQRWLLRSYGIRPELLQADQRYIERPFQLYP